MSLNAVEVARPRNFPNEVGGKNVTAVGDCRAIVAAKIAGDLGKRRATGAAVGGIGGQAVRPGIGNVDHGVAGETLLQLRLQRVVVCGEEIDEEKAGAVADVRPQHRQLVGVGRAVDGPGDDDLVRGCWSRARSARSCRGAIQIGCDRGLVEILETGKMDAVASVIADVGQPGCAELMLNVETPLLGVRGFVVDRHARLDGERGGGSQSSGGACRIRESAAINVQVSEETLAEADVEFRVTKLEAVIKIDAIASANRSAAVTFGIPSDAKAGSDSSIELLANFAAKGRLGANKPVESGRVGKDETVQGIVAGIASAAGWNAVDEFYIHRAGCGDARSFRGIVERRIEIDEATGAIGAAGISRLAEEGVPDSVGEGNVFPDSPGILAEVFELVVKNVGGDVERGLGKRAGLSKQKIREGLFKRERTVAIKLWSWRPSANRRGDRSLRSVGLRATGDGIGSDSGVYHA